MVPTFDAIFSPMMKLMADGASRTNRQLRDELAVRMGVTDEMRAIQTRNKSDFAWNNRCAWALTYLVKAGFLERPERGQAVITQSGRDLVRESTTIIDLAFLRSLEPIKQFHTGKTTPRPDPDPKPGPLTPDEMISVGFDQHQASLATDVLAMLRQVAPAHFEQIVVELLVAMGYGGSFEDAASVVGKAGDGGIDGVIKEDRLGLDAIYVQAKRWQGSVGQNVVNEFLGALMGRKSDKGVLITTGTFSKQATNFVQQISQRVILVDGPMLADLMVEHGVGVNPVRTYVLKRIDADYFDRES